MSRRTPATHAARPKKRFGQHFLSDPAILDRIVEAAEVEAGETVLEIGPGLGALTATLAEQGARVVAVEVDRDLVPVLRERFAETRAVSIIEADAADHAPADLLRVAGASPPYAIVANLPYNVAALILRRSLESPEPPSRMVVMVQLEVAQSIVSAPPHMTLLGVATQVYAEAGIIMRVGRGAFRPPPQVESAVVRIDPAPRPRVDVPLDVFFRVVRAGFGNPRKMLRNSLSFGLHVKQERIDAALAAAGIDPALRAQALSLSDWEAITRAWIARPDQ